MSKTLNRRDFLSYSAMIGAAGLAGSAVLTSCGKKGSLPLREKGTYYVPDLVTGSRPGESERTV